MTTESVPILMYHAVDESAPPPLRRLSVATSSFARQIEYLAELGFTGMTFADFAESAVMGQKLPDRPVVLTFDDGYADFADNALPILAHYNFPATVFVTTGWVADAGPAAAGKPLGKMLTWAQVRELAVAGIEIGAHSHSHPQLDQCSDAQLRAELRVAREKLEDQTGHRVRSVAYPFGYSTPRVRKTVRAAGYECAASVANTQAQVSGDPFDVPRLTVRRSTSAADFASIISGHHRECYRRDRLLTASWSAVRAVRRASRRIPADA